MVIKSGSSQPPNPLFVSYHWLTTDGEVYVFDGWRSEIRPVLQPFATEVYCMQILVSATPGLYTLRVNLSLGLRGSSAIGCRNRNLVLPRG